MKKISLLLLILLILPNVMSFGRLEISTKIQSYSEESPDEIYVGSLIFYNITLYNPNDFFTENKFRITIEDSEGNRLHTKVWDAGILYPNQTRSFLPYINRNKDYDYISPLKADTYILKVVSKDGEFIEFFENKTIEIKVGGNTVKKNFFRYKTQAIEFIFPVESLTEKRLKKINEEQFKENMELNNQMLNYTKKMHYLNERMRLYTFMIFILTGIMTYSSYLFYRKIGLSRK